MRLDTKTVKKINDFVYTKPRTVQEIAQLLSKNWRTADKYVDHIAKDTGSLAIRTFRGGTKGALKIVFWNNIEKIHSLEFQEKLMKRIEAATSKGMFSPLDIYQYVEPDQRKAVLRHVQRTSEDNLKEYIKSAQNQILSFSGNLSWVNKKEGKEKLIEIVEQLAENNISLKILSKVTVESINNVRKLYEINKEFGKNIIEVRHREHPLRGFVIDDNLARFREVKNPLDASSGMSQKILLFYEIYDKEWIEWFQKVFWYFFRISVSASKRMKDLETIQNLYKV